jgi:hypothetical protein
MKTVRIDLTDTAVASVFDRTIAAFAMTISASRLARLIDGASPEGGRLVADRVYRGNLVLL